MVWLCCVSLMTWASLMKQVTRWHRGKLDPHPLHRPFHSVPLRHSIRRWLPTRHWGPTVSQLDLKLSRGPPHWHPDGAQRGFGCVLPLCSSQCRHHHHHHHSRASFEFKLQQPPTPPRYPPQTELIDDSGGLRLPQACFMMSLGSFGSGKESLLTS